MTVRFDFDELLESVKAGKELTGKDGVLAPLIKRLTEAALEAELESHLADARSAEPEERENRQASENECREDRA
jgi:transposase-like protein